MNAFAQAMLKKGLVTEEQVKATEPKPVVEETPKKPEVPETYEQAFLRVLFNETMGEFQNWHTVEDIPEELFCGDVSCVKKAFQVLLADPYRDKQVKLYYDFLLSYLSPEFNKAVGNLWSQVRYCSNNSTGSAKEIGDILIEGLVKDVLKHFTDNHPLYTPAILLLVQNFIVAALTLANCPSQTFFDKKKEVGKGYMSGLKFKFMEQRHQAFCANWFTVGLCFAPYSDKAAENLIATMAEETKKYLKKETENVSK